MATYGNLKELVPGAKHMAITSNQHQTHAKSDEQDGSLWNVRAQNILNCMWYA